MALAILELPDPATIARPPVTTHLERTGVTHPVTAVLLDFRGYDTWLEVGVLVLAALGILALHRVHGFRNQPATDPRDPMLPWLTRVLIPFMVLAGGYLLWRGTHGPGGAFQAGAVLGAAGVLLRLVGERTVTGVLLAGRPLRVLSLAGFAAFAGVAAAMMVAGHELLDYPVTWSGTLIGLIEGAVTVSIAWTLAFLYIGSTPQQMEIAKHD